MAFIVLVVMVMLVFVEGMLMVMVVGIMLMLVVLILSGTVVSKTAVIGVTLAVGSIRDDMHVLL